MDKLEQLESAKEECKKRHNDIYDRDLMDDNDEKYMDLSSQVNEWFKEEVFKILRDE